MLGAALLWFGWFGFNGGAAGTAEQAGLIWVNTLAAPAAAMLGWLVTERIRDGHPTSLGAASGIVAGLVAITPACANVSPIGAIGLGLVAGIRLRPRGRPEVQAAASTTRWTSSACTSSPALVGTAGAGLHRPAHRGRQAAACSTAAASACCVAQVVAVLVASSVPRS